MKRLTNIKYTIYNSYYRAREQKAYEYIGPKYLTAKGAQRVLRRETGNPDAIVYAIEKIELTY